MKAVKFGALCLAMALQLTACASSETQNNLRFAKEACAAGNRHQCRNVPSWERQSELEANENMNNVALGVLLVPLIAAAAIVGAAEYEPPEREYHTRCRSRNC